MPSKMMYDAKCNMRQSQDSHSISIFIFYIRRKGIKKKKNIKIPPEKNKA